MAQRKTKPTRAAVAAKAAAPDAESGPLPSREQVLAFVQNSSETVGKREIARAFGLKGPDRIALKRLLQSMADDGVLQGNRKSLKQRGSLPPVGTYDIVGRDADGDLVAEPQVWDTAEGPKPKAIVRTPKKHAGGERFSLGAGDRILARAIRLKDDTYGFALEPMKKLPKDKSRALGIFRAHAGRGGGSIEPVDKRELKTWPVPADQTADAKPGDLVRFDLVRRQHGVSEAKIVEVLGNPNDQRQISLIAVHTHGIPDEFPQRVIDEVGHLPALDVAGRRDLRQLPLLTIDPVDARDHDDAVYATPSDDPHLPGGFRVIVAIADVATYVRPGTAIDREARKRGNSVYFPDRVVPMLPERISNDLCSLREGEDRPCLAVEMIFDASGQKREHQFFRAMMRSAAKLSYQEAQEAIDGRPTAKAATVLDSALKPLWQAYAALSGARDARGPLDLDLPERKIVLDKSGRVADIVVPERLVAHRLIEEFMIQANVAAAETLETLKSHLVYRVHEPPSKEKLAALRDFLETLDLAVPHGGQLRAQHFNGVLAKAKGMASADLVNEVVLRAQSQAVYAASNAGHFGLHLKRYAHFTSPIRRYADLIVHRCLVRALGAGRDGITDGELAELHQIAEAISQTERRAMTAERETTDRLIAAHLADRIGADFTGRIAGVTRSGLFVRLAGTGADGFIPIATLQQGWFQHDATRHALVGERGGGSYQLGATVRVRLVEAVPMAGALRFEMLSEPARQSGASGGSHRAGRGPAPRGPGRFKPKKPRR